MQTKFNPKEKVYIVGTVEDISINADKERYRLFVKTLNLGELITVDGKDIFPITEDKHTEVFKAGDVIVRADTLGED